MYQLLSMCCCTFLKIHYLERWHELCIFTARQKYITKVWYHLCDKFCAFPLLFPKVKSTVDHKLADRMESYFLAETLKYLYLLFTPDHWLSLAPQSSVNISELLSVPGGQQLLYHSQLLRNGCSVGQSGYVLSTEAHPIDVGALHCCQHRLERTGGKGHQKIAANHGCPAPPFHSRLELFTAKIKPVWFSLFSTISDSVYLWLEHVVVEYLYTGNALWRISF